MALKTISLLLLGALNAEALDSNEAAKAMSKFVQAPATRMSRPAMPVDNGATFATANDAILEKLEMKVRMAEFEKQRQDMNAEYQHLRARIEKLSQADVNASISAPSSSRWFAALIASLGLAATMGVAAVKKATGQGQQGTESTTAFQIPLVAQAPQRAGAIVAMAQADQTKGSWDPLNLADGQSSGDKVVEVQHGRILAGMIGAAGIMQSVSPAPGFAATGAQAIDVSELPSQLLSLEVTEAAFMAVVLGTFVPCVFLITLYIQSEAALLGERVDERS